MAAQSNFKNMVISLTVVCLVCSTLLAVAYAMTKEPIEQASIKATNASVAKVLPSVDGGVLSGIKTVSLGSAEYEYYELDSADGVPVAYAVKSSETGFGGQLVLMVGISAKDLSVYRTAVLSHSETPGLGAKCETDRKFISQFEGLDASNGVSVSKDGGRIDAITGSTITSRAYCKAVQNAAAVASQLVNDK